MSDPDVVTHPVPAFTRDDYRRLAVRIRRQREARGWKQRELSQRSGISADRLSRLERGAPVRVDELCAFSFAFGLRIDELMFAVPGSPQDLDPLVREILGAVPAEDLPAVTRLLQALAAGLRIPFIQPEGGRS